MLVLKVCKTAGWAAVPSVVATRFPWDSVSLETLRALAEAERINPNAFTLALGRGRQFLDCPIPDGAPTEPQDAPQDAPEPQDEPEPQAAPEPEPVAPVRRTRQGR